MTDQRSATPTRVPPKAIAGGAQVRIMIAAAAGALVTAAAIRLHLPILTAIWASRATRS